MQCCPVFHVRKNMYKAIVLQGGSYVRYTEYPGVGHDSWRPALNEPTLYGWFLAHKRGVSHGEPGSAENFHYTIIDDTHVQLTWSPPSDSLNSNNQIWYYKIFRNNKLIAEVDNIYNTFTESISNDLLPVEYKISTVNYFFKESVQSELIAVNNIINNILTNSNNPDMIKIKPNPVSGIAIIDYIMLNPGLVVIEIYDARGKLVKALNNEYKEKGRNQFKWDSGHLKNGLYICKIITDDYIKTEKFIKTQ